MNLSDLRLPDNITVNIVFPGRASTAMTRSLNSKGLPGCMKIMMPFFRCFFAEDGGKSAKKAAESTISAAILPDINKVTGKCFDTYSREQKLHKTTCDEKVQERIVEVIEEAEGKVEGK
jgi:hypothetical protein